jgi:hypothetical protein
VPSYSVRFMESVAMFTSKAIFPFERVARIKLFRKG